MPTDDEFDDLLKEKDDIKNIKYCGNRSTDGSSFGNLNMNAHWWSSSQSSSTDSWRRSLHRDFSNVYHLTANKLLGFSVRCVK
jgi:uncharacterized protein (TIGR02145 family)